MSLGTPSRRESEGLFRLVADSLPLPSDFWPDKRRNYFNKQRLDFTGRPSSPRSAMVGQMVCTRQTCRIA
jgi:hypothetical protein